MDELMHSDPIVSPTRTTGLIDIKTHLPITYTPLCFLRPHVDSGKGLTLKRKNPMVQYSLESCQSILHIRGEP